MQAVFSPLGRALVFLWRHAFPGVLFSAREGECRRAPLRRLISHQAHSRAGHGIHGISFVSSHDAPPKPVALFSFSPGSVRFQVGPRFCLVQGYHPFHCHFPFLGHIITHSSRFVNSKFAIFSKNFYAHAAATRPARGSANPASTQPLGLSGAAAPDFQSAVPALPARGRRRGVQIFNLAVRGLAFGQTGLCES